MALRIKAHWHDEDAERSIDEIGSAIAFNAWRIAKEKAINLHGEDFVYEDDHQRFAVMIEYLIFQLALVDRIVTERLEIEENNRRDLIMSSAKHMSKHVQDNMADIFGAGDYIQPFIAKLNQRGAEYSDFNFTDEGPTYPFMRHLGYEIQQVMGAGQENRWVIDQVMDKDGIDIYNQISRVVMGMFE
jgi:hypothetical protein